VTRFDLRMVRVFQKDSCDGGLLSKSGEARLGIVDAKTASGAQTLEVSKRCAENVSLLIRENVVTLGQPGITKGTVLRHKADIMWRRSTIQQSRSTRRCLC
jgi:hypothetical protein